MKIQAISDQHGYLPELEKCDLLLIAGDILPLAYQASPINTEIWLNSKFIKWINDLQCQQVIAVLGNHDIAISSNMLDNISKQTKNKIEFLFNNHTNVIINGETLLIWGSPWCKIFGTWAYMATDDKLAEYYSSLPKGCDICLTHDAPAIGDIGVITQGSQKGVNAGNKVLAKIIKEKQPRISISGHIHSSNHKLEKKKGCNTLFATVSLIDEQYKPVCEPLIFEL